MASEDPTNEPLFEPGLKKKSKKKFVDFDMDGGDNVEATEANGASAPAENAGEAEENPDDMFGGLKKKSKKKKAIPMDLNEDATEEPAADGTATEAGAEAADAVPDGDLDFGEMKKKKKKSKKGGFDLEAFEKELGEGNTAGGEGEDAEGADDAELGDDPFARDDGEGEEKDAHKENAETWHGTDRDYTYQELLGRIFSTLRAQNPALSGEKRRYVIVPPVVQRDGSKKTVFANVIDICKRMHRQPDHVIQYLFTELGTVGSVDGSQRLVIRGRFQPAQIEKVLRKYIVEYVTCKTCRSPQTSLTKENRIYFMTCESCGSTRSVTTIKTGFQAQTGKRSKTRAQA